MKKKGIVECRPNPITQFIKALFSLFCVALAIYYTIIEVVSPGTLDSSFDVYIPLLWITFVLNTYIVLAANPKFVLLEDGLNVNYMGREIFVAWKDIYLVKQDAFQTFIFSEKLPALNYLIGIAALQLKPAIIVGRLSKNYQLATEIIEENVPKNRFKK